jgi:hypothetical protein
MASNRKIAVSFIEAIEHEIINASYGLRIMSNNKKITYFTQKRRPQLLFGFGSMVMESMV